MNKNQQIKSITTLTNKNGIFDLTILLRSLEKFHKEHLVNCINNCDLMFFESVIYDSFKSEIYFRNERGDDQSLTDVGGTPSTLFVEDILKENNVNYEKFKDSSLNNYEHKYDWPDTGFRIFNQFHRRFWIIKK